MRLCPSEIFVNCVNEHIHAASIHTFKGLTEEGRMDGRKEGRVEGRRMGSMPYNMYSFKTCIW